ncbi:MAG: OmpA family protein [Legionellales bacterium]|nr:OmpA family protein [Legionellales bacterium]
MAKLSSICQMIGLKGGFLLLAMVLLVACQSNSRYTSKAELDRYGVSPAKARELERHLAKRHIKIIRVGEDYLISLPNSRLFYGPSPRIQWEAYRDLNLIAEYLHQFSKITVMVVGHTDDAQTEDRNLALSRARAQNIADYLWSQNIDTRVLKAKGQGSQNPIATNVVAQGRADNQRVEIIFRKLMV